MNRVVFLYMCLVLFYAACSSDTQPIIPIEEQEEQNTYVQYGTPFTSVPAVEDIIMYEVNIRAHGPNANLQAIIQKLDYIDSLGVNVIWLMPIYPIGSINSVNSPYSIKDYKAVNPAFGSLEDLRSLTDQAHERGIAVILDWVANHTAWDHPWIDNPGWYSTNSNGEIIHPPGTNWMDVADLNFDNTDMRAAMIDAMLYWVYEANVDGFRCDYADGVPYGFWQTVWDTMDTIPNRDIIAFAEGARSDHFQAGFDMSFGWEWYSALKVAFNGGTPAALYEAHLSEYNQVAAGKEWLRFTTNHDETAWDKPPTIIFGGLDGAMAAFTTTLFTGGVPLIYSSQEIGVTQNIPFFSQSVLDWSSNPSYLQRYVDILGVYKNNAVFRKGNNTFYPYDDIFLVQKDFEGDTAWVLINLRDNPQNIELPAILQNNTVTNILTGEILNLNTEVNLDPYSYLLLED